MVGLPQSKIIIALSILIKEISGDLPISNLEKVFSPPEDIGQYGLVDVFFFYVLSCYRSIFYIFCRFRMDMVHFGQLWAVRV